MATQKDLRYQLWDVEAGNAVGGYPTEAAAMAIVQVTYREHGAQYVETLLLARSDDNGHIEVIADGEALMQRIRKSLPNEQLARLAGSEPGLRKAPRRRR